MGMNSNGNEPRHQQMSRRLTLREQRSVCAQGRRVEAGWGLWALRVEEAAAASSSALGRGEALLGGAWCLQGSGQLGPWATLAPTPGPETGRSLTVPCAGHVLHGLSPPVPAEDVLHVVQKTEI